MKQAFYCMTLAGAMVVSGIALAGEHGGMADQAKLKKALGAALVLSLAEDLQLDEQQTIALVKSFVEQGAAIQTLKQQQEQLRLDLMAAADAGGTDVQAKLDQLIQVDQQLHNAKAQAAQQVGASLPAAQRAKVYLLVTTLDSHVEGILGGKGGQPGPCPKCAAGACPQAGTPVAEAVPPAAAAPATPAIPVIPVIPATPAPAADPKTAITQSLQQWGEGLKAQKIDQMMEAYSENFKHYEYGDKAGVRDFMQQAIDMGYLEGIEVATADTKVEVNGDEATAYPVELTGNFGQVTIEFTLKNENGAWKIVGMDMSGV